MKWLFRCNIASERYGDEVVQGIGHAMRCIALARGVEHVGDSALLSVEGEEDVTSFLDEQSIEYVLNESHTDVAEKFGADIIVTDINYLERQVIERFREIAPVVNLAPRGKTKYYADISFTSEAIVDVPEPSDSITNTWHAGPEFTIINDDFIRERKRLLNTYGDSVTNFPKKDRVIVHMGGVDKYDRTGTVLDLLDPETVDSVQMKIIAGPFNPNIGTIQEYCKSHGQNVSIVHAPDNLAKVISESKFAVLGTGISTYEALSIGVPSINIGVSEFHDKRGEFLMENSLGDYLGAYEKLSESKLNNSIKSWINGNQSIKNVRENGFDTVDGNAIKRIIDITQSKIK